MSFEPIRGNVLVFVDGDENATRLSRWITAAGETAVLLTGREKYLMREGDDESIDLLVTDLDTEHPDARSLLLRLAGGELFSGIPQIHLLRDLRLRDAIRERDPAAAAISTSSPPEAGDFQARVRLAAEVGRLRRERTRISVHDAMTGLFNRRYLLVRLEQEFSRSRRYRTPLSLVLVDVDHLKRVNDRFGLGTGDAVIRRIATLIAEQIRKEDVLGRAGEESFAILLPGNRYRGAAVLASKIRTDVEELRFRAGIEDLSVHVSAGISTHPDSEAVRSAEDLLRTAENALAEAKARGGNRVFIDDGVLRKERRLVMIADADRTLLDLADDLLSLDDYRVVKADSARALFETIRFRRPDLLILDLSMKPEAGEPAIVERIHEMFPDSRFPVIGLSTGPAADPDRALRFGVDRFITKPFSLSVLRSVARELLDAYHLRARA